MIPNKSPVVKDRDRSFFDSILDMIDSYSGMITLGLVAIIIISLILTGSSISSLDSSIATVNDKVHNLSSSIDNINDDMSSMRSDIGSNTNDIADIQNDIDILKIRTNNISALYHSVDIISENITTIKSDILDMKSDISAIKNQTASVVNTNITMTFVYFNQTASDRYCHLWVNTSGSNQIREIMISIKYPKTNISLLEVPEYIFPVTSQYVNDSYKDNYMIYWYEKSDAINVLFNISWQTSNYNTSNLPTGGLVYNCRINTYYIDDVTIRTI